MKRFITLLAIIIASTVISSCQKEDAWTFNYPKETLCSGTWQGKAVNASGYWIDITSSAYSKFQFSIRFNTDGTYYGKGYFGTGSGTYKATGNTITTYVDGELFYTYEVISMTGNEAELTMTGKSGSSMGIRVAKD